MNPWRPLLTILLLACASCAANNIAGLAPAPAPQVRVIAMKGSDWQSEDIACAVTKSGDGYTLDVTSTAGAPASTLLLELQFDPDFTATTANQLCATGMLSLLVADKPGLVALGVIMPEGEALQPGGLLTCNLQPANVRAVTAAPGPGPDLTYVDNLSGSRAPGNLTLEWSYYLRGDYDQNSEVNIADLSALGSRFGESANDGVEDEHDGIVDGDHNGEVNIADLSPIGAEYGANLSGYNIYSADGPDAATATATQQASVQYDAGQQGGPQFRRQYSQVLTDAPQLAERYFFVRATLPDGSEGTPSNVVDSPLPVEFDFAVPPPGQSIIDPDLASAPSIALLPGSGDIIEDGAPVVAYTKAGGGGNLLYLAHYQAGQWQSVQVNSTNYALPRIVVSGSESSVIVYDVVASEVVKLVFNETWEFQSSETIGAGGGGVPLQLDVDVDPATGFIGVAHGYLQGGSSSVLASLEGAGGWDNKTVYSGADTVAGLTYRFDPNGGEPWLVFTHGTIDTSSGFFAQFDMEAARFDGTVWTYSPIAFPDSPLRVDLDFDTSGTPKLAFTSARDITIPIVSITSSLQFDGKVATFNGTDWDFDTYFQGTMGIELGGGFPPTEVTLNLEADLDTTWARPGELSWTLDNGGITLDLTTFLPTGGQLVPEARYSTSSGRSFSDSAYFTGLPGRDYSWDEHGTLHSTAYIQAGPISSDDVLSGDLSLENDLLFWRP